MEKEMVELRSKSQFLRLTVAVVVGFILHSLVFSALIYGWANQTAINEELLREIHNMKQVGNLIPIFRF